MRVQQTPPLGAIPNPAVELRRLNQGEPVCLPCGQPNQTLQIQAPISTKPNKDVPGKTSGAEEDTRKEATEAFEAEAASQDHGHVQDQPEQVLGGVGGGLQGHNHCQGASDVACSRQHGGGGAAEQRERGEGEVEDGGEAAQWKAGSICLPLADSSIVFTLSFLLHTSFSFSSSAFTPLCFASEPQLSPLLFPLGMSPCL